jgi:hypothetical protein
MNGREVVAYKAWAQNGIDWVVGTLRPVMLTPGDS